MKIGQKLHEGAAFLIYSISFAILFLLATAIVLALFSLVKELWMHL